MYIDISKIVKQLFVLNNDFKSSLCGEGGGGVAYPHGG